MKRQANLEGLKRASWWKPGFISRRNDVILWRLGAEEVIENAITSDCLFSFMGLSEGASSGQFETFAKAYGVLNLDAEGVPLALPETRNGDLLDRDSLHHEDIHWWRFYAQDAVLLIAYANALHDAEDVDEEGVLARLGWQRDGVHPSVRVILHGASVDEQRASLAERLQRFWISRARIAPVFVWAGKQPSLQMHVGVPTPLIENDDLPGVYWNLPSAFDVIAAELSEAVLTNRRLTRCDNCKELMLMSRKPRTDQPHYCPVCSPIIFRELNRELQRKRYEKAKLNQLSGGKP